MVLQITSMADIFTILLVFLLKSFSMGVSTISPSKSTILPEVKSADPIVDTMKIEVSEDSLLLDGKQVSVLHQFKFESDDYGASGSVKSLTEALDQQRKKNTQKKVSGLLVMADQRAPFETLKRVLNTANQAGFEDYKLVVAEEQ